MTFTKNDLTRVRRMPERGHYDAETIYKIVDEAIICHVGIVEEGRPIVIPTIHARIDDTIVFHGAPASRLLKQIKSGAPLCVTVTLLDGLVLARSAFHSSMNYRSALLFGRGTMIEDPAEKARALEAMTNHVARGRWADVRPMTQAELDVTLVIAMQIEDASAKVRTGPPNDADEDYALPIWAGVLPLTLQPGAPIDDPRVNSPMPVPQNITNYTR